MEGQYYTLSNGMKFHYFDIAETFEIFHDGKKWRSDYHDDIEAKSDVRELIDACIKKSNEDKDEISFNEETLQDCANDFNSREELNEFINDFANGQHEAWSNIYYSCKAYENSCKFWDVPEALKYRS